MNKKSPQDLQKLANFLDSKFEGPMNIKFGWDGVLGLVPIAGDTLTTLLSLYIVARAALLGCPPPVLMRMGGNILVEGVANAVPVAGDVFDFFWKSNIKNLTLLERYLENPKKVTWRSKALVILVIVGVIALAAALLAGSVYLVTLLFYYFTNANGRTLQ